MKSTPRHSGSEHNDASVPERIVRASDQFFDRLEFLFPEEGSADGIPSVTDVLLLELPIIRDALAGDFLGNTVATADPDVRVFVGGGVFVRAVAVFAAIDEAGCVEMFWMNVEW